MITKKIKVNDIGDLVGRFNTAFEELERVIPLRGEELECIKLALVTRQHVMLNGPPGTAKSYLANNVFKIVKDPEKVVFSKQLMPGTIPEEVFGPPNAKDFREKGILRYNTAGMFPEAHFAFLDEVYRGPGVILNSLLCGLNERVFYEGPVARKMPLHTCIGTTNFVANAEIMDAFRDRWLLTCEVVPAKTAEQRLQILNAHLERKEFNPSQTLTLAELNALADAVEKTKLPPEYLSLYDDIVAKLIRSGLSGKGFVISDRRYCQAAAAIKAGLVLSTNDDEPDLNDILLNVQRVFRSSGSSKADIDSIASIFDNTIKDFEASRKFLPLFEKCSKELEECMSRYDAKLPKSKLQSLLSVTAGLQSEVQTLMDEALPADMKRKCETLRTRIGELSRSIEHDMDPSKAKASVSEDEEVASVTRALSAMN